MRDKVAQLRQIQRNNDPDRMDSFLCENPNLEFTDEPSTCLVLSLIYLLKQDHKNAEKSLGLIESSKLTDPQDWSDYGLLCFLTGRSEEALYYLRKVVNSNEVDSTAYARYGSVLLKQGQLEDAKRNLEKSLELEPERAEVLNNLAGIEVRRGNLDTAVKLYSRALYQRPDLTTARQQRTEILIQLDQLDDLIEEQRAEISKYPEDPSQYIRLAQVLIQGDRFEEAISTLDSAVKRFPDNVQVKEEHINILFRYKRWVIAGKSLLNYVEDHPDNAQLRFMLNEARIEANFLDATEKDLNEIESEWGDLPGFLILKARLLMEKNQYDEAVTILKDVIERFPGMFVAYNRLAHALTQLGQLQEADEYLQMIASINPHAFLQFVEEDPLSITKEQETRLLQMKESASQSKSYRASVGFTLANVYDKQGRYEEAFHVLNRANQYAKTEINYDWRNHRRTTQKIIETFTPELVERLKDDGHPSAKPIFIVGMPRSGTTLTEQILCSHSDVYGGGELPWMPRITKLMPKVFKNYGLESKPYPEAMDQIDGELLKHAGDYYLENSLKGIFDAKRLTDKLPHNFDNVGLIALIYPNASIIHMDREPRDIAISNYFQYFGQLHGLMGFAFDLKDIGHMLNDHDRIMQHWHDLFPGRIYELNYQKLVNEPGDTIEELLSFCGLSWDENVLKFYETKRPVRTASIRQVRQGFYTSSAERWKRYEEFLDELEEILAQGYLPLEELDRENSLQNVIAGPTGLAVKN